MRNMGNIHALPILLLLFLAKIEYNVNGQVQILATKCSWMFLKLLRAGIRLTIFKDFHLSMIMKNGRKVFVQPSDQSHKLRIFVGTSFLSSL